MKPLVKIMFTLFLFFTAILVLLKLTGFLTLEDIQLWLKAAKNVSPFYVALLIIGLLFADLFMTVPTLPLTMLSGYFLGPIPGALTAMTGMVLAGVSGYAISRKYGDKLVRFLVRDPKQREEAIQAFHRHGAMIILLSRAAPVLPEVSACMSGISRMHFAKFILLWLANSAPYAFIVAYAGSVSTLEDPKPAIFTAIGVTVFFWLGWALFRKVGKGPKKI